MDYPPILITGPTTGGKTAVALELATQANGELVTADMFHMVSEFPLSTGLVDLIRNPHPPLHLYQTIRPDEPLLEPIDYGCAATRICAEIAGRGRTPILEGCSLEYARALRKYNCGTGLERLQIFCLTNTEGFNLEDRLRKRVDVAVGEGLMEEVAQGITRGYEETPIMRTSVVYEISRHLYGEQTLDEARENIVNELCRCAKQDRKGFLRIPGITWLEIDPTNSAETASKILEYACAKEREGLARIEQQAREGRTPLYKGTAAPIFST